MGGAPQDFICFQVPDSEAEAEEAFAFHQRMAADDMYLVPRSETEIEKFAFRGELYGVRLGTRGDYVGLCYATLREQAHEWEIGGLAVLKETQALGIGTALARFALCCVIANDRPWDSGDEVMVYVHEENEKPRGILEQM